MDTTAPKILIVDDNPNNHVTLRSILEPAGYELVEAFSGKQALKYLLSNDCAVILLDVVMPVMDGFEVAQLIRDREKTRGIPIIFVTGLSTDQESVLSAYSLGAIDFITTPVMPEILRAKVAVLVELQSKNRQLALQAEAIRTMEREAFANELIGQKNLHELETLRLKEEHLQRENVLQTDHAKKLEHQAVLLEKSNSELERFAYVASHDLQEPLRLVINYLQLLELRYKELLPDEARDYISTTINSAKHMKELIAGLLAYSRIDAQELAVELEEVDCAELMEECVKSLQLRIGELNAEVEYPPMPKVRGDRLQLYQVFQNLVSNALKFVKDGDTPRVRISVEQNEAGWVFSISDNGIGIEEKYLQKIFQIFQRLHTREAYPGTGIGLALCRRIIERHGGKIWVDSHLGRGSNFRFSLPLRRESEMAPMGESMSEEKPPHSYVH